MPRSCRGCLYSDWNTIISDTPCKECEGNKWVPIEHGPECFGKPLVWDMIRTNPKLTEDDITERARLKYERYTNHGKN